MLCFPVLLKNIWLAWHLSGVKIACHLVSGHHAIAADGDQRWQPRDRQAVRKAFAKGRIHSWRGHRADCQAPRSKSWEVKQGGQREGQDPSAFHRQDRAGEERKRTWMLEGSRAQW